jgi:hypothetical protein
VHGAEARNNHGITPYGQKIRPMRLRPGACQAGEVGAKQLELLHLLVPTAAVIALLVNPNDPILAAFSLFSCGP